MTEFWVCSPGRSEQAQQLSGPRVGGPLSTLRDRLSNAKAREILGQAKGRFRFFRSKVSNECVFFFVFLFWQR